MDTQTALTNYFRAAFPCVCLKTSEEQRAISDIQSISKRLKKTVWVWDAQRGLVRAEDGREQSDTSNIGAALNFILSQNAEDTIYILLDMHQYSQEFQFNGNLARTFKNVLMTIPEQGSSLVLLGVEFTPWTAIQNYVSVLDYALPNAETLRMIAQEVEKSANKKGIEISEELIRALSGLSTSEAENALSLSVVETGKFSPEVIYREKIAAVKRNGLLEIVTPDPLGLDSIGGLDNLKSWILKRKKAYSSEAENFGLPVPKGILLVGIPGSGKSLSAKAFGTALGIPTLKLDIGSLFSSLVGDSEAKTKATLELAEAMAPCVTGDTIISLADGSLIPIYDLYRQFNPDSQLEVMCWNEQTGKVDQTTVQHITKRNAATFKVKCALGFSITSTGNHPHLVMRGKFPEWVETKELRVGDMMAVPVEGLLGNEDATRFWPESIRKVDGRLRKGRGGFMDSTIKKLPTKITQDLAWLIASVSDGDGYLSADGRIGFTNTREELLSLFENTCEEFFGVIPNRRLIHPAGTVSTKKNGEIITSTKNFYGSYFNSKLTQEFIKTAWKHSLSWTLDARKAAIAGLLDSDGTIGVDKISLSICTDKERRITHARALLLSIGVIPASYSGSDLFICGVEAVKLAKTIGKFLRHNIKQKKCSLLAKKESLFTRGAGFSCSELLKKARKYSGLSHKQIGTSTSETYAFEHGRHIPERKLKNYIKRYKSPMLQSLIDYQCRWVGVESITSDGDQDVYDLVCSGENTRSFIANLMITHNCVIWADEIDKGLSGAQGSGNNDSGVTRRVFGAILEWMQNRKKPVFVVATANQVENLPPEFLRKGRFDEIFALDLPTPEEREQIIKVQLKKYKRDPQKFSLQRIIESTNSFSGAEIEGVIVEALYDAFDSGAKELTTEHVVKASESIIPLSKVMAEKIEAIRQWSEGRARSASIQQKREQPSNKRRLTINNESE